MSTSQLREDKHYYFMYKNNCIHLFCIRSGCINNVLIVKSNSKTCLLFFFHNVDTILQPFEKKIRNRKWLMRERRWCVVVSEKKKEEFRPLGEKEKWNDIWFVSRIYSKEIKNNIQAEHPWNDIYYCKSWNFHFFSLRMKYNMKERRKQYLSSNKLCVFHHNYH